LAAAEIAELEALVQRAVAQGQIQAIQNRMAAFQSSRRVSWSRPGRRVSQRADNLSRELGLAAEGGILPNGLDVTGQHLTPNDLMALSQRYRREYGLVEFRDGTMRLYAGPQDGREVLLPITGEVRRSMHTHPGFGERAASPSPADLEGIILQYANGGGGAIEIIFRERRTGRTRIIPGITEEIAVDVLIDLMHGGLYIPTDPVVTRRIAVRLLQRRFGNP
jgi:hypothetical protein